MGVQFAEQCHEEHVVLLVTHCMLSYKSKFLRGEEGANHNHPFQVHHSRLLLQVVEGTESL